MNSNQYECYCCGQFIPYSDLEYKLAYQNQYGKCACQGCFNPLGANPLPTSEPSE